MPQQEHGGRCFNRPTQHVIAAAFAFANVLGIIVVVVVVVVVVSAG